MRKKLLSIHNMRAIAMEQTLRKQNNDKHVQVITMSEYRQKLEQLLQKLTVQTKYTNRVSQCNLKNIEELEQVKQQLNYLLEMRKMQEANEVMLKNLSNQLAQTLNQAQQKLLIVTNQLFQLKNQLKQTKKQLVQMKKINSQLEVRLRESEKTNFHSMIELYDKEDNKLISTLIEDYIKEVNHPSSIILYKHCVQALRTKNFNDFIKGLQRKMNVLQTQNKESLRRKEENRLQSAMIKRKISSLDLPIHNNTLKNKSRLKFQQSSFRLPSFRMRTQSSVSQPKYSLY